MNSRRTWVPILFLVSFAVIAGCSNEDSRVVGEWKETFVGDDGSRKPGADLTIDKDHHWRELFRNLELKGSWSLSGNLLTLKIETFGQYSLEEARRRILVSAKDPKLAAAANSMAAGLDKPVDLNISEDGKTLSRRDEPLHATAIFERH